MSPLLRPFTIAIPKASQDAFQRDMPALAGRSLFVVMVSSVGAQLVQEFGGGPEHVIAMRTAPFVGLLASLLHVRFGRGRSPLAMIALPEALSRVLLCAVAFASSSTGWLSPATLFTIVLSLSHALSALTAPYLGTIYGLVYPSNQRARIVAFGRMVSGFSSIVAAWSLGKLLAWNPESARIVYPILGLLGLGLTWYFCTMPVAEARKGESKGGPSAWSILKKDSSYRWFQIFQFILGFANLAAMPLIDIFVRQELGLSIDLAVLVVSGGVIMQSMTLLTVRFHGGLFERLGVLRHRVLTSSLLAIALVLWAFTDSLGMAILAALLAGLGMAGGQIIWIIGSLSFAPRDQLATYTGIHTFLTGLRGISAPLFAMWMLNGPMKDYGYRGFFLLSAGLVVISVLGHAFLVREPTPREPTEIPS